MSIYYINKFKSVFLKSGNTKKTVSRLHWISLPTAMDAKGLKRLKKEYGWDCLGCFDEICKLAASCAVWGALVDDEGQPLDETDIAVKIDADIDLVKRTLAACMHPKINWIKKADSIDGLCINSVSFPPKSPLKPLEQNGDSSEQTKDSLEQNATLSECHSDKPPNHSDLSEQNGDSLGTQNRTEQNSISSSTESGGDLSETDKGRIRAQLRTAKIVRKRAVERVLGLPGINPDAVWWCIQRVRERTKDPNSTGLLLTIIHEGDWRDADLKPAPPSSWGEKSTPPDRRPTEKRSTVEQQRQGLAVFANALGRNKPAKEAVA